MSPIQQLDPQALQHAIGGAEAAAFAVSHEIISPRDAASGLPTGKRM